MVLKEKLLRLIRPYKRTVICQEAGITQSTLSGILAGKHEPQLSTVRALARTLGVSFAWLVDDDAPWPPVRTAPARDQEPIAAA